LSWIVALLISLYWTVIVRISARHNTFKREIKMIAALALATLGMLLAVAAILIGVRKMVGAEK